MANACCENPKLVWSARRVAEHEYADVLLCGGCGRTHVTETYQLPVLLPTPGRCLDCGGAQVAGSRAGEDPLDGGPHCAACNTTDAETTARHRTLASDLVAGGNWRAAAFQALDQGRQIRALKLATAAVREDPADAEARAIRLQILEGLGYGVSAAREALEWAQSPESPDVAWTVTAELERANGNLEGALRAMQRLLRRTPSDHALWLEYAELLLQVDQRATALDAAAHALADEHSRAGALDVITRAAQRCVESGQLDHTRKALEIAGDWSTSVVGLLWVRAQLAAREEKVAEAVQWLERTLAVDPGHVAAKEALALIKPAAKSRWRLW